MDLIRVRSWLTLPRIFLILVVVVLAGFIGTVLTESCRNKPVVLPNRPVTVRPVVDTTTPKPTVRATVARGNLIYLRRYYPAVSKIPYPIVLPPLPTSGDPTPVLRQQVVVLTAEAGRLRKQLLLSDSVLTVTRSEATVALEDADRRIQVLTDTLTARAVSFEKSRTKDEAVVSAYAKALQRVRQQVTDEALTDRTLGFGRKKAMKRIIAQMPIVPEQE